MAYVHRDERPGFHHVVTRGNNKRRIFEDDTDRWFFCTTVERLAKKYGWTVLAYCLMDNHYHLVLTIREQGLSRGMCELNTACALHYNARHGRINHLFGKRYWNRYLTTHATTVNALRYVVQNPRRAGGADHSRSMSGRATRPRSDGLRPHPPRPRPGAGVLRPAERAIEEYRAYCAALPLGSQVRWQPP